MPEPDQQNLIPSRSPRRHTLARLLLALVVVSSAGALALGALASSTSTGLQSTTLLAIAGSAGLIAALLVFLVLRMVRRAVESEADREAARVTAVTAQRASEGFLAEISGSIRTPLTGVIGMTALLGRTNLTELQSDHLATLERSADKLVEVVDSFFAYAEKYQEQPAAPEGMGENLEATTETILCLATSGPPPTTPRVLVVDDYVTCAKVAAGLLERLGCQVEEAHDGLQALDALCAGSFDLMLIECGMSDMDGFQVTRSTRTVEAASGKHLQIIAMTATAMPGDREACLAAGMDDHIDKPLTRPALEALLTESQLLMAAS